MGCYFQTRGDAKMLSNLPINLKKVNKKDIDKQILRLGMIAELDAVSLYEQLAAMTEDKNLKKILLDIAKEEKTHIGEFQALLLKEDKEQVKELEEGKEEIDELTK
jgi:rubrerythrin